MVFAGLNGPVTISGVAFLFLSAIGFIGAYLYGRASPSFRWRDYVALLSVPVLCIVAMASLIDLRLLVLFVASMGVGFVLELVLGRAYHKTLGTQLWQYNKNSGLLDMVIRAC